MLYTLFEKMYVLFFIPAFIFSLWAQFKLRRSFNKYSKQRTANGMTGAAAAYEVLRRNGIDNVQIEMVGGNLTDHYDPRSNVIRLSESVYSSQSVAAVGVAAHEAGHALQYAAGYFPVKIRASIIPVTRFGTFLVMPLVMLGLVLEMTGLINIAIALFTLAVVFQIITLPVEYNASRRAVSALGQSGVLAEGELPAAKKVLSAAALTYVAALAVSLMQLLRLIALSRRKR